mgnify:FL=1
MTIGAVILAAGSGSRWEGPDHKLVHPFRGKPLISWSLEAPLEADFDEFIVITGSANLTSLIPEKYTEIHNPDWESGQASSLKSAVNYAESMNHESLVIGLGDTPFVNSESWNQVLQQSGKLVCASYEGKRRPPFKIHKDFWQELPTTGDQGARNVLNSTTLPVVEVSCGGWPDDIDTVEDLKKWN